MKPASTSSLWDGPRVSFAPMTRAAAERDQDETRAADERRGVRPSVPSRPANPVHWGHPFYLDEALPAAEAAELRAFFERFTVLADDRSVCTYVVGPATDPGAWRAAWADDVEIVELGSLRAQIPPEELSPRLQRLRQVLARPSSQAWSEFAMLITTWDAATLPIALAEAEPLLARWPDELRHDSLRWQQRPELRRLARVVSGELGADHNRDGRTYLRTRDLGELERHQHLCAGLTALDVSGSPDLPARVARLTGLRGLERLILQHSTSTAGDGEIDLTALLAAPHLQRLTALSLDGYALSSSDLEALAGCTQRLERLRIQHARLQPGAARALARLAARTSLRSLDLKSNDLGPDGAQTLFANPGDWRTLEVLDLSANDIGDRGATAIAGASLVALRWLNLASNSQKDRLTTAGVTALAASRSLAALHTLNVFGHPIGAEGVAALLYSPHLRGLRALNAFLPGASLAEIADACGDGEPVAIEALDLGGLDPSEAEVDLSRATFLRGVTSLGLHSLEGLEYAAVLGCPLLERLEVLVLGCPCSDIEAAWTALTTITPPPTLRYVDLSNWALTAAEAAELAASPLGRQVWGVQLMACDTPPDAWYELYRGGVPLVERAFDSHAPSEHGSSTTFRETV